MRIEQLNYILEVAKQRSISQAANKLFISQPSLSVSIRNLEKELKTQIFYRSLSGVEPTDKGQLIIKQAKIIVNEIERLKNICSEEPDVLKGNISITALPALCNILLEVLSTFNQEYPKVNMVIKEDDNCNIIKELETGKTDIGLAGYFEHEKDENLTLLKQKNLHFQELFTDELCIYAGSNNPLVKEKSICLKDTYNYPIVIYKNNMSQRDFTELKLNYANILRFNDRESMKKMASNSNTLIIFPKTMSLNDLYVISGDVVPLDIIDFKVPLYLGIVSNERNNFSNIQCEFIRILKTRHEFS